VNRLAASFRQLDARSPDPVPQRVRMLKGCEIYITGAPCAMCMSAIYWSRIDRVYFASTLTDTSAISFDDAHQYEDFAKPWAGEWWHAPGLCMLSTAIASRRPGTSASGETFNRLPRRLEIIMANAKGPNIKKKQKCKNCEGKGLLKKGDKVVKCQRCGGTGVR
jgi:hypothetical protein